MSSTHWKGVPIPAAGDDLLAAWRAYTDAAGIIATASSVAAARTALTTAVAAGAAVTPTTPAFFMIGGVVYTADGTQTGGVYKLAPINERELVSTPCTDTSTYTYASGMGACVIATSTLSIRPYDRVVEVDGCAYGSVTGSVDLGIHIGTKHRYVRFSTGQNTAALHLTERVAAGADPGINLVVYPRLSGSSIALSGATDYVGLDVAASPVTMA
jgi:cystathionine beta-lyase/cystathionine gamma-synthase